MKITEIEPIDENVAVKRWKKSNSYRRSPASLICEFLYQFEKWYDQNNENKLREKPLTKRQKIQIIKNIDELIQNKTP